MPNSGDPSESGEQILRRLEQLYAISKLFASFENVEQTFDPALGIVAETLPLRSAIIIETFEGRSQIFVWSSEGQTPDQTQAVRQHAETTYKYLIGVAAGESLALTEQEGMTPLPPQPDTEENDNTLASRLMVIPLVVAHRPSFGVLQLEGARQLDKADLMFVNSIANQLAIALDRDHAWRRDIARRQHAEALAEDNAGLYQRAQRAVRVREQILAVVSHDLKNPLGAILMTIDRLQRHAPVVERRRGLSQADATIRRAAQRMLRLIDDLLDVASLESGNMAVEVQPHEVAPLLEETVVSFEGVVKKRRLRLTAAVAPDLPKACCDRDRILQVLSNLVGNATKVTAEGGQVALRVEARGRELLFAVSDDGPGIAEADLKHLFESYWRSGGAPYKGTGLGLAIARGIVEAHGGRIWPESTLGHGATFFFTVPAAGAGDVPAVAATSKADP